MINIYLPDEKPYGERIMEELEMKNKVFEVEQLMKLINNHKTEIPLILTGQRYYDNEPDIIFAEPPHNFDGIIDKTKPDWRIPTAYHANMVDQKVEYMVGDPPTITHQNNKLNQLVNEHLDDDFSDDLIDILKNTSNKGNSWLHIYIDENGGFNFVEIPTEEIIPIWADRKCKELDAIIRHYISDDVLKVEYWTKEDVTYYEMHGGSLVLDYSYEEPYTTHYDNESWGRVPFVEFKNNSDNVGDIWRYKAIIDAINKRISDLQNTFDESTDLIHILKGYEGEDLREFMVNLKHYKAINVAHDGDVDTIRVDVPVQSSLEYLQTMKEYLIQFGRGVDFSQDKLGNSPSGISIKFLYGNLDLKVKPLARKTHVAIQNLIWFILKFYDLNADEYKTFDVSFNYNRLVNELEQTDIVSRSQTMLSQKTLLSHHPFVTDVEKELEQMNTESVVYTQDTSEKVDDNDEESEGN